MTPIGVVSRSAVIHSGGPRVSASTCDTGKPFRDPGLIDDVPMALKLMSITRE